MNERALEVPGVAWALGWACLAAQVLSLADRGAQSSTSSIVISMLLGAVVIGWFSHGVLTGGMVRVVIVWILFLLGAIVGVVAFFADASPGSFLYLAIAGVQLYCLWQFTMTDYFAGQRERPKRERPELTGLILIAVVVGVLGGIAGAGVDDGPGEFRVHVNW